jgi:hypothetical protein
MLTEVLPQQEPVLVLDSATPDMRTFYEFLTVVEVPEVLVLIHARPT